MDLEEKLKAEWPGILRWMIDGCLDWRKKGLQRPEVVTAATAAYFFEDQDLVGQWLDEKCDMEPGNPHKFAFVAELFEAWTAYANVAGERPGGVKIFSEGMVRMGLVSHRMNSGRGFRGVRLRSETGWSDGS